VLSLEYPEGPKFQHLWPAVFFGRDGTAFEVPKHQAVKWYSDAATAHPATRPPIDELGDPPRHLQLARHTAMCRSGWMRSQPCSGNYFNPPVCQLPRSSPTSSVFFPPDTLSQYLRADALGNRTFRREGLQR